MSKIPWIFKSGRAGTEIAFRIFMLSSMTERIREWLFPAGASSRTVTIQGSTLCVENGSTRIRTLSLYRLAVPIPGEFAYGVEYRLDDQGEFKVDRGSHGSVVVRNKRDTASAFPVCWLPKRFVGKRVDRYITHVDGKKVEFKAGFKTSASVLGSEGPSATR